MAPRIIESWTTPIVISYDARLPYFLLVNTCRPRDTRYRAAHRHPHSLNEIRRVQEEQRSSISVIMSGRIEAKSVSGIKKAVLRAVVLREWCACAYEA